MCPRVQIDCVSLDERLDPYARIRRVGGPNTPGVTPPDASKLVTGLRRRGLAIRGTPQTRWSLSVEDAIQGVLDRKFTFLVQFGSYDLVNIEVATSPSGLLYLKAEVDRDTPDHLLFLPPCR